MPLSIRLDLHATAPPAGAVVLTNTGPAELRLWRTGNTWGDPCLYFEISAADHTRTITRSGLCYTRNVPSSVGVPPGASHVFPFDFGDGTWQYVPALQPGDRLTAIYAVPVTPDSIERNVWTGTLRSEPFVVS